MPARVTNIAKNTSYFTLALVIQKLISLTYFTLYARVLGPADLGKYYLAISLTSIFAIFIDIGLSNVLTREVAKYPDKASNWLGTVLAIKIPLAIITTLAVVLFVNILGYPLLTKELVYISIISMVLDSFTVTFFAVSRGFHNLKFESVSSVIVQSIILVVSLMVFHYGGGVRWLMFSLVLASSFNFCYSLFVLWRYWRLPVRPLWRRTWIKKAILLATPFAGYGIFQRAYIYLDTVLLSKISGDVATGIYQIPFKIINALQFLPMAFIASLYPALSLYWQENREQLSITFNRAMHYSAIISLPLTIGGWVVAEPLVAIFSSSYTGAVWPLRLCLIALPFMFLGYPIGSLLNACDEQRANTRNMFIVLITSVVMNLLLIPPLGAVGASITVVITNGLLVLLGLISAKKIAPHLWRWLKQFGQTILASLIMGVIVWLLRPYCNVFVVIIIGALVYGLALLLTGSLTKADVQSVIQSFRRRPTN
ncbi:flippase [Patescibacteria group bacterium]|nr:flippase [Patescibacteria group bacterium]HPD07773.1 flippase [bacterium]HRT11099.1 flippase [Patescibacteria group bacterium]HRU89944.1 flippase [Patescibacteria group bacterium]